jgi:hypothetical protein
MNLVKKSLLPSGGRDGVDWGRGRDCRSLFTLDTRLPPRREGDEWGLRTDDRIWPTSKAGARDFGTRGRTHLAGTGDGLASPWSRIHPERIDSQGFSRIDDQVLSKRVAQIDRDTDHLIMDSVTADASGNHDDALLPYRLDLVRSACRVCLDRLEHDRLGALVLGGRSGTGRVCGTPLAFASPILSNRLG